MLKVISYPLSWLFGLVVFIRNRLYDFNFLKSTEFEIPVISVGNITVGGTGKTPHVEYLVELIRNKFEVAVLSRGYKRKTKGFRWVETSQAVSEVGDEPLQIKRKFPDISVSVCENRVKGVETLLKQKEEKIPDVVVLDDAFQHRRITPGINILLIDYTRPVKQDRLLPAGRLREGIQQMRRANIIVFTKCPAEVTPIMRRILQKDVRLKPYQSIFFTRYNYLELQPVFNAPEIHKKPGGLTNCSLLVVTGIASPIPVHEYLSKQAKETETMDFPDHHNYTIEDVNAIIANFERIKNPNKIIVTTEKDAIRLKELQALSMQLKNVLYFLPVKITFLGDQESFNKRILGYVGENKSNRRLHKKKD